MTAQWAPSEVPRPDTSSPRPLSDCLACRLGADRGPARPHCGRPAGSVQSENTEKVTTCSGVCGPTAQSPPRWC